MVRVFVERGVIASGQRLVAGTFADISDTDARILIRSSKVRLAPPEPTPEPVLPPDNAPASGPARETASRGRRRSKAVL